MMALRESVRYEKGAKEYRAATLPTLIFIAMAESRYSSKEMYVVFSPHTSSHHVCL